MVDVHGTHTELIGRILARWSDFSWRHHGTGMLQAYVPDEPNARVHIWHPSLVLPGMVTSGAMHNHRFGFRSDVLLGSILHTDLDVMVNLRGGAHQLFRIDGASAGSSDTIRPSHRVTLSMGDDDMMMSGCYYEVDQWDYHWARPNDCLAVTWVTMTEKAAGPASLVAPYGTTPVHAFGAPRDSDNERRLCRETRALLERKKNVLVS